MSFERADTTSNLPTGFQQQVVSLGLQFVPADSVRFLIFSPIHSINQGLYSEDSLEFMEREYAKFWSDDPMHPSFFEDTDINVVSNTSLMSISKWKEQKIYQQFFSPAGYFHDMDTYFRVESKIVGVLTMLRCDERRPFTKGEIAAMEKIHPFIEYCMKTVFIPARIKDRQELMRTYDLTLRELDVLEYALSGLSNKELVKYLNMGLPTLRTHLQRIYEKVGVHSTSELIAKVLREIDFDSSFSKPYIV